MRPCMGCRSDSSAYGGVVDAECLRNTLHRVVAGGVSSSHGGVPIPALSYVVIKRLRQRAALGARKFRKRAIRDTPLELFDKPIAAEIDVAAHPLPDRLVPHPLLHEPLVSGNSSTARFRELPQYPVCL